jgi:sugar/nucleoside kinase (ribokinase family)
MTITVIGHLCLDTIRSENGTETQSYGGIFFSVTALANLLGKRDTIHPVFGVGKADYDTLIEKLNVYPNVDTSSIYKINGPTNQVELTYNNNGERVECSKNISEPIPWKKIKPYIESDIILINMISGFDITLETLDEIRMNTRDNHTPIYMDVHSLTLGIREDYTRFHRPVDHWRRWLFMLHGVQMNAEEAAILPAEKLNEDNFAKHILALNTKVLNVTRGGSGCTAFIDEHKHVHRHDIAGITTSGAVDPTGCGDVFAAAYCAMYGTSKNILSAVEFANTVAAAKSALRGSDEIDSLSSFRLAEQTIEERAS